MFELISSLDTIVQTFAEELHAPLLTAFFRIITEAGNLVTVSFITTVVVSYFLLRRRTEVAVALLGAFAGVTITVALLKFGINRARPDALGALMVEHFSSFPSLHAALAVSVYGVLAHIGRGRLRTDAGVFTLNAFFFVLVLLIGVSRIYLGVHYFSDVLGGYFVGLAWYLTATHYLTNRAPRWTHKREMV